MSGWVGGMDEDEEAEATDMAMPLAKPPIEPSNFRRAFSRPLNNNEDGVDKTFVQAPIFRRGMRSSGSLSRLSTMIRRSLRLPSRESHASLTEPIKEEERGDTFTKYSPLRVTAFSNLSLASLEEIQTAQRLNRLEKVKKLVRTSHWPARHEVRAALWRQLCQSKDYDSSTRLYLTELENSRRSGGLNPRARPHSPAWLSEKGAIMNNFGLSEPGVLALLRLLTVIEHLRPDITSAPMLYPIGALFLHFLPEEDTFACLQKLLQTKGFLMTSSVEFAASPFTLLALVKKHKTNAYSLLKKRIGTHDDDILVEAMRDWLSWIFAALPLDYVVRVVDCFLVEGHKFITRVAIAIVYMWSKAQKKVVPEDTFGGMSGEEKISAVKAELLATAAQCEVSLETFVEAAIRIRNFRSETIARLQQQFERKVREEQAKKGEETKSAVRKQRQLFVEPFSSVIVDCEAAAEIMVCLPARLQLETPRLLFRLSQDGASFTHLWAKYFGTGESFVWKLDPDTELPVIYGWVGNNNEHPDSCPQMFMAAGDRLMVIGSGDGDAIRISEELTRGMSSASRTFNSPPLVFDRAFDIDELEVFDVPTSGVS